ncbi:MAG TPA: alkaline phosphatase family protein, partial [Polyangiaceae bacterium]
MMKLRQIPNFLLVVVPALTWLPACGSDDDGVGSAGSGGASAGHAGAAAGSPAGGTGGTGVAGEPDQPSAGSGGSGAQPSEAGAGGEGGSAGGEPVDPLETNIDTIVFIYAENRSFDNLYGNFPGAHNLSEMVDAQGNPTAAYVPQKDRDGTTVLPKLPKTWGGATVAGNPTQVAVDLTDNLPNQPFGIENAFVANGGSALTTADVTRDLAHRFFENIMEINGGTNDMFGAWVDAGGLTMGHFDYSNSKMYKLAQQYVLADNFFEGAFGGSFLNHQYLICACAPSLPASFVASNLPSINELGTPNAKGVPQLALAAGSPASALDGAATLKTGNVAPLDYFGAGDGYRAVNTMQAPYQPSGNPPVANAIDLRYANAAAASTVPPQTQVTIGELLSAKGVSWAW